MITLYTQPGCVHCETAKAHLLKEQIVFDEINVMQDAAALKFLKDNGHTTVPQLYLGTMLIAPGGGVSIRQLSQAQILRAQQSSDKVLMYQIELDKNTLDQERV